MQNSQPIKPSIATFEMDKGMEQSLHRLKLLWLIKYFRVYVNNKRTPETCITYDYERWYEPSMPD
jgi:hypothetical protein